ncbi:hypothetical protein IQ250_15800 [Pseudanabaenaceae cyanobacterium LEGE 13415]|nr:hypothetical protein [Pseudanabaenaceae cyanobacterium LEGE 13415]
MNIDRREAVFQMLVGGFRCTELPSEIPDWITVVDRVTEPGYWGQFDWQSERLQELIAQSVDFLDQLPEYLSSLGFEGVETVEWSTIDR